jgi:hypothetical protein
MCNLITRQSRNKFCQKSSLEEQQNITGLLLGIVDQQNISKSQKT